MPRLRSLVQRLAVILIALSANAAIAETPDAVAKRALAVAWEGGLHPLTRDAKTARFSQSVRSLRYTRCVRVESIEISTIAIEAGDRATLHAGVALAKRAHDARAFSPPELVLLRIEMKREQSEWRIAEIRNRDEELADRLLLAPAGSRRRILDEDPARITKGLARALYARALASLNAGKFADAGDPAGVAKSIAIEAGDRAGEALATGIEAHVAGLTDVELSRELSARSLAIAQLAGDPDALARAWYDFGRLMRPARWNPTDTIHYRDEIASYRKAMSFGERAEDPTTLLRALYSLANRTTNSYGDHLTARRYIDRGMAIARETGDALSEMGFESVLATIYFNQGDPDRGVIHNRRALEIAESNGSFGQATLRLRAAWALREAGRFEEARAAFAQLLVRTEKGVTLRSGVVAGPAIASALRALGVAEAERGNYSEAECLIREGTRFQGSTEGAFLFELAPYHAKRGDHAAALSCALASAADPRQRAHQSVGALLAAARAYRALGMIDEALETAAEAIEIRETMEARVAGDEQQKANAAGATTMCYELAAELALDRGDAMQALTLLERGRARVLTEILDHGRPGSIIETDGMLQEQQAALDREVARVSDALDRETAAGNQHAAAALTERLSEARAIRASFFDGIQARAERRRALRVSFDAAAIAHRATTLPPRAVAIQYLLGDDDLHIFVIDATSRVVVRTHRGARRAIERAGERFVTMLGDADLRVEKSGREMYDLLIAPVAKDIAGADALIVIPDDILWRVPFAALVDREGRFLVERAAIVYAPSLTAYASIAESPRRRRAESLSLFAIGNPTPDEGARGAASSFYRVAMLEPLPDAEHEVDGVGGLYDGARSLVLKRGEATESRTRRAIRDARVVHFATHAILDDANPMYSRLLLARDGSESSDGWLESWEVARLDLGADLIVLSACETARGRVGGGEGVVGLSWSFLLAGARAIVATQWKVASDSTAAFMIAFHRSLRAGRDDPALQKAQSIREAQLQLLRDARTRHPFHWAAFVLLGDPAARKEPRDERRTAFAE